MERFITQKMAEHPKSSAKWPDESVCGCQAFRSQTGDNFLKTEGPEFEANWMTKEKHSSDDERELTAITKQPE